MTTSFTQMPAMKDASDNDTTINGRWTEEEKSSYQINVLELLAIKHAILAFLPFKTHIKHIRVMSDNQTAISHINKQGGTKGDDMILNDIAVDIWTICFDHNTHISAAHIPGKDNVVADVASREFNDAAEWMISSECFEKIVHAYGCPDIDLFATRINTQLPEYVSWHPDPYAKYIDAFTISWSDLFIYLFPPFSLIWPVLSKMEEDRVKRSILVVPNWPTQSWYPRVMEIAVEQPMHLTQILSSRKLSLPGTNKVHLLALKLKLLAVVCSWEMS